MDKTLELEKRIKTLEDFIKSLQNASFIPLPVDQAFRKRFIDGITQLTTSSHASENQAVNEAGAGTYNVAKPADGFFDVTVNGAVKAIPYYD